MRWLIVLFLAVAFIAPSTASAGTLIDGSLKAATDFWGGDPCADEGGIRVTFDKLAPTEAGETLAVAFHDPKRPCIVTFNINYVWAEMPHEMCNVMTHEVGHVRAWMTTHDPELAGHHDEAGIMRQVIEASTPQCDVFARNIRKARERAADRVVKADLRRLHLR
jgi:hypothetical protein